MTITVTINAKFHVDRKEELEQFLEKNLPNTRSAQGCRLVEVLFDIDNPALSLREEWVTVENHQQYISEVTASGVFSQLLDLLIEEPNVQYLEKTSL